MPRKKIAPSETMRQSLQHFLVEGTKAVDWPTSTLVTLAARVILQEALEAESGMRWGGNATSGAARGGCATATARAGWKRLRAG